MLNCLKFYKQKRLPPTGSVPFVAVAFPGGGGFAGGARTPDTVLSNKR